MHVIKEKIRLVPFRFWAYFIFVAGNWFLFAILRVVFFYLNNPPEELPIADIIKAFFIGFRFDLRLAFLVSLPFGILCLLPSISAKFKRYFANFYGFVAGALGIIYVVDFCYYSYLSERLNAYITDLAENTLISLQMVWETYPVPLFALCILLFSILYYFFAKIMFHYVFSEKDKPLHYLYAFVALLITAAFVHGQVSQYPLRWSNAYFSKNAFISSLALNPVQNLFDTYIFAKEGVTFDEEKTKEYYSTVANFLGVADNRLDRSFLNFERPYAQDNSIPNYNVVIILTESLAFDKTSFAVPELNTTPALKQFADKGVLFTRFFTPAAGTAKGVYATITGLPDVAKVKTSSRNPLLATQKILLSTLTDYEKFYFLGGSASWANIRGLLEHNIEGLRVFEEGSYDNVPRNDVWGISDLDMFKYAVNEFTKVKKPFFALLQTSGFHRPYTIPTDHGTFENVNIDENTLEDYGFGSLEEFNSLRFQDYAMGVFFKEMEEKGFLKNTIFMILGDHGLTVQKSKSQPQAMIDFDLNVNHTPLVVVAPNLTPKIDNRVGSQVDITATLTGLLGMERVETTLGRNLFNSNLQEGAFILASPATPLRIGFIQGDFYYIDWDNRKGLFKYTDDGKKDYCGEKPNQCKKMSILAKGLYEASRYIAFNNKP